MVRGSNATDSAYVKDIENQDAQAELYNKCVEYWAVICEKYFSTPEILRSENPNDFKLVDSYVKFSDPHFDPFLAVAEKFYAFHPEIKRPKGGIVRGGSMLVPVAESSPYYSYGNDYDYGGFVDSHGYYTNGPVSKKPQVKGGAIKGVTVVRPWFPNSEKKTDGGSKTGKTSTQPWLKK